MGAAQGSHHRRLSGSAMLAEGGLSSWLLSVPRSGKSPKDKLCQPLDFTPLFLDHG